VIHCALLWPEIDGGRVKWRRSEEVGGPVPVLMNSKTHWFLSIVRGDRYFWRRTRMSLQERYVLTANAIPTAAEDPRTG
jgi:hypothetical protein